MEKRRLKKSVRLGLIAAALVLLAAGASVYALEEAARKQAVIDVKQGAGENVQIVEERSQESAAASGEISLEDAKVIALEQVPGAADGDIAKAFKDYDDGRVEYDVEIRYNGYEYDFEIDGASGRIVDKDSDRIEADDLYDDRFEYDYRYDDRYDD